MKISVIVPVYNTEVYLKNCIESILNQTFSDFELILVDDGSTDNSGNICDFYSTIDPRIKVIHQHNQGQAAARNNALKISNCEWVHFVDSDDLIHPQMLEILYNAVLDNKVEMSMCEMQETQTVPEDFSRDRNPIFALKDVTEDYLEELYSNGGHKFGVVPAKLIKKRIIDSVPFTNGRIYEDHAVSCQWIYLAKRVADTQEPLYCYITNPESTTHKSFSSKTLDFLWAKNETLDFFYKINYFKMFNRVFIAIMNIGINYYNFSKDKLHNKIIAKKTKQIMRSTYKKYKNAVNIDNDYREYILNVIYPIRTKMICRLKRIYKIFKA